MPVFDRFEAARKEVIPGAYLLAPQYSEVAALLRGQGIEVRRLGGAWSGPSSSSRWTA
jgi:hypothetical protein